VAREPRDVHEKLRDEKQIGQTPGERALVDKLVSEQLVDLSRRFEPGNDQLFTWWAPWRQHRQRNIGWRLDFVLASAPLAEAARSCRVSPEFGSSDHAPVTAIFELDPARLRGGPPPAPTSPAKKPPPAAGQIPLL
jgi:exodeoxyribonuclease-3